MNPELQKLAGIALQMKDSNPQAAQEIQRFIAAVENGQNPPPLSGATVAVVSAAGGNVQAAAAGAKPLATQSPAPPTSNGAPSANSSGSQLPQGENPYGGGNATAQTAPAAATPPPAAAPPPSAPYAASVPTAASPHGSAAQDTAMAGISNDTFVKNAMRAAGMNPNMMTEASSAAMKGLAPIFSAARAVYGQEAGAQAGGLTDFINKLAQQSTQQGGNFFGDLQKYAQGVLGGSNFQGAVGGLSSAQAQNAAYQNLLPLLYAGSNGLIQQSAGDQAQKAYDDFNYQDSQQAAPGHQLFTQWLSQQNLTPTQRSIFGGR